MNLRVAPGVGPDDFGLGGVGGQLLCEAIGALRPVHTRRQIDQPQRKPRHLVRQHAAKAPQRRSRQIDAAGGGRVRPYPSGWARVIRRRPL